MRGIWRLDSRIGWTEDFGTERTFVESTSISGSLSSLTVSGFVFGVAEMESEPERMLLRSCVSEAGVSAFPGCA